MADTGERRPIIGRANAKEAETVRESSAMISEERSTEKASNAAFRAHGKGKKQAVKATLAEVKKEMGKTRVPKSARKA